MGAKEDVWDEHNRRLDRLVHQEKKYAIHTPSGIIIGTGTEKPKLSAKDKRNFWKVIRLPVR